MDTLGKRIKKVIMQNGITMTSFAKELNISQSMVSKMCSDKATPSDRTISDICRLYNINNDWLLNGVGEMEDTARTARFQELNELLSGITIGTSADKNAFIRAVSILPESLVNDLMLKWIKEAEEAKKNLD